MKILVSAYACEPDKGSEPGVGWNWVHQIARFHDVWVITRANNREPIERALTHGPLPNVDWIYYDIPRWLRFWKKGGRGIYFYYVLWQMGVYFVARRLHQQVKFDLIHHVTFVNYWMPSLLPLLDVPFIWGPVGGGDTIPRSMYRAFDWQGKIYEYTRETVRQAAAFNPFVRIAARRAALAIGTTAETADRLQALGAREVTVLSQVALAADEISQLGQIPVRSEPPFRLCSIGRLVQLKGFHLALRAFAQIQSTAPDSEFWLIGDGPQRRHLELLAQELGIAHKVRFWGNVPRSDVFRMLGDCDVLIYPSMRDSGGMVVVEAMAAGRPVICLDLAGPAMQVTEEVGFKIPPSSTENVIGNVANAMQQLASDRMLRETMSKTARQRVRNGSNWDTKGNWICDIYEHIP